MDVVIHPRVQKYIEKSGEKERIVQSLKLLSADPYSPRSGVDIKNADQSKIHWNQRFHLSLAKIAKDSTYFYVSLRFT